VALALGAVWALSGCHDRPRGGIHREPIPRHTRDAGAPAPRAVPERPEPVAQPFASLASAAVIGRDEILAVDTPVGPGTLWRFSGGRWSEVTLPRGRPQRVLGHGREVAVIALDLSSDGGPHASLAYAWRDGAPVLLGTLTAEGAPPLLSAAALVGPDEVLAGGLAGPGRAALVRWAGARGTALRGAGNEGVVCMVSHDGEAWIARERSTPLVVRRGSVSSAPSWMPRQVCALASLPDGTLLLGGPEGLWSRDARGRVLPEIGVQGWSIEALAVVGEMAYAAGSTPGQFARREGPRWIPMAAPGRARTVAMAEHAGALVWVGEDGTVEVR
jgi:hypothetical protein